MSSDGDHVAFQNSVNDNLEDSNTVLFNDKNYTFIVDSTSSAGSFNSGQIQFDLSTLSSQSSWINLNEAVIEFPVKITGKVFSAGGAQTTATTALNSSVIIKNGWHQFIDGCQLIINGQTIQSMQQYENVAATFRQLSTWSQDELIKFGPSCGVALDDMTCDRVNPTAATGLANAASSVATSVKGFDGVNNQTVLNNKGVNARNTMTNTDIASGSLQTAILGASAMKTAGRSHVAVTSVVNTANTTFLSAFYMATIRLKDICDINDFPMVKNLKGFIYLAYNTGSVNITSTDGAASIASVAPSVTTGRTCPFLINTQNNGLTMGNYATSQTIQIVGTVDASTTGAIGSAGPLLTNARLLAPYYIANPKADMALTQANKYFTTLEKIVTPIIIPAGSSVNYTITSGVANPRKLLLLPMWQNLGGATTLLNPEISCFDPVPGCSGVFAEINNLQVYVANRPVYQYPLQYTYEQWIIENSQLGLNGAAINEATSQLLTEQLFQQNYRFNYVDLSRRMDSEDGTSKSIQVSMTNPSADFGMKVIGIVWYEKKWLINTSTCTLSSV